MERTLGLIIGGVIAVVLFGGVLFVFGGMLLTAAVSVLAVPLAMPMTTTAVIVVLGGALVFMKSRK